MDQAQTKPQATSHRKTDAGIGCIVMLIVAVVLGIIVRVLVTQGPPSFATRPFLMLFETCRNIDPIDRVAVAIILAAAMRTVLCRRDRDNNRRVK